MHCQLCGHGPVIDGVCGTCRGRPFPPSPPGRGIPPLLWLPAGAFALTALIGLITFLSVVSGAGRSASYYDDYGTYDYSTTGGAVAGAVGLLVVLGAGIVALRLLARRPAARAFAVIGSVTYLLCALFDGEVRSAATVLPALLCTGAAVTLAVAPSLRAYFVPPYAPPPQPPTSIVVVRTILAVSGVATALYGLLSLVGAVIALTVGASASRAGGELGALFGGAIGAIGGLALAAGLVCTGFAVLMFWALAALGRASRVARVIVTVLGGLNLFAVLLFLAAGVPETFPLTGLVFNTVLIGAVWLPADARRHFGEPPLPAVEQARGAVTGIPRYLPTIATTAPQSPPAPPIPAPRPPMPGPFVPGAAGVAPAPSGPPGQATPDGARRSGRHAAVDPTPFDPPTERFTAVTPASAATPDEPSTEPVPVVGPAGHASAGTDT